METTARGKTALTVWRLDGCSDPARSAPGSGTKVRTPDIGVSDVPVRDQWLEPAQLRSCGLAAVQAVSCVFSYGVLGAIRARWEDPAGTGG